MEHRMNKSYLKDERVMRFIRKLKALEIEALIRQEIFFAMNLKELKKYEKASEE